MRVPFQDWGKLVAGNQSENAYLVLSSDGLATSQHPSRCRLCKLHKLWPMACLRQAINNGCSNALEGDSLSFARYRTNTGFSKTHGLVEHLFPAFGAAV